MYQVEVMLGETDETHIIRTIEYWDNEKRRWPQRQHFPVIVAEHINRRFFNVIHLLSQSIPIIAVQASLLDVAGQRSLFFSKVLDTYEEIDDGTSLDDRTYNREYWTKRSRWTLEAADALLALTQPVFGEATLNYLKYYVAVSVGGNNYFWLHKRSSNKSLLGFRISQSLQSEAAELLDAKNIAYVKKPKSIRITVDRDMIAGDPNLVRSLAELVKRTWRGES